MKCKIFLICSLILSCLACNPPNVFDGNHKYIDQFPKKLYPKAEKIVIDIPGIVDFAIVDTFLLALILPHPEILFQAYSLNSFKFLGTMIKKGTGPDEFLQASVPDQSIEDSTGCKAWMIDYSSSCFYLLNITKTIERQRTIVEQKHDFKRLGYAAEWVYVNDTLFWATNWTIDNLELFSYNMKNREITSQTKLFKPVRNASYNYISAFSHGVVVKPDLSKIVINMLYLNQLQIISLKNTSERFSFSTSKKSVNFEQIVNEEDLVPYYWYVRATDQFIFASYVGFPFEDRETKTMIHVFDWDGNPIAWLGLPYFTPYFALDEKRGCLYGLANGVLSDDGLYVREVLYKYDIKELLMN